MPRGQRFDAEMLQAALVGFQQQREQIDAKIREIRRRIGTQAPTLGGLTNAPKGKRRVLSAAARRLIAAAQKKRWAAFRKRQVTARKAAGKAPAKKKAESRKAITRPALKKRAVKTFAREKLPRKKPALQPAEQLPAAP